MMNKTETATESLEAHAPPRNAMQKMPGHWLLAKMGKRVLRPGGLELTRAMLERLDVKPDDAVVEFAPGLGVTARMTLERRPASYTAVERDEEAAAQVQSYLRGPTQRIQVGSAESTGLPDRCATVVYGEAMLTMHGPQQKLGIACEAFRLLKPGGRYGIHELAVVPDDLSNDIQDEISREMSRSIHVGARPLTVRDWREVLKEAGFRVQFESRTPMHLLKLGRLIEDEGLLRTLRFIFNIMRTPEARHRVLSMRNVFRRHRQHLSAIMLVAIKP